MFGPLMGWLRHPLAARTSRETEAARARKVEKAARNMRRENMIDRGGPAPPPPDGAGWG